MTKLLIATKHDDIHSYSVKAALNKHGHEVDFLYNADFPLLSTHSFKIAKNKFEWLVNGTNHINDNDYDIIWYRRPEKPTLPDYFHPDDISNAEKEITTFSNSMWQAIFPNIKWINPLYAAKRANSKLLQLKLAEQSSLNIPETLISNNPKAIKNFIKKNTSIYKSLYPAAWINDDEIRLTYTNDITIKDLPSDKLLQYTPGIFQKKIDKKYELRITYFGSHYIAVKIDSQKHQQSKLDWRSIPPYKLSLVQVDIPRKIDQECQELMKKLGIVFGCFDFIVTPDNEHYFLEVNEQGQFLWIEANNPEIKMLQAFAEFITGTSIPISLNEIHDESVHHMQLALKKHHNLSSIKGKHL